MPPYPNHCKKHCHCKKHGKKSKPSIWLFTIAYLVGCQSAAYRADRLPAEFRAVSAETSQAINLEQIAAPGASESILAPGDLLEISVATGRNKENRKPILARVSDDGTVDVPVVGPVPVAGSEEFEASQNIARLAIERGMYRHPIVTVEIKSKAVNRITVLGAVLHPGVHELPRGGSDLVSALAAAGGLNGDAGTEIEIIRQPKFGLASQDAVPAASPSSNSGEIQLAAYQNLGSRPGSAPTAAQTPGWTNAQKFKLDLSLKSFARNADYRLNDRDIVRIVPRTKDMIYIAGLVRHPGQFELPTNQDMHLLDAVALAGGRSSPVADKVFVIRRIENVAEPLVIEASLSKAKGNGLENLRLSAGDTISLEQTPATTVVDTLSKFFRLSFGVASSTIF